MYENLVGKKLLIMDRTALAACAVKRAKELGIKTIVANFYKEKDSPSKQIADEKVDIDISDIDGMVKLIKDKEVDGIFVGWTDSHLPYYAEICKRTGLPCIGTKRQFEIFSNDKKLFKEACSKVGVPVPKLYNLDINFRKKDLNKIEYPVMCKPADGSGGRGIMRCDNEEELIKHYKKLYSMSITKNIIVESYIESENEIFVHYLVKNRKPFLSTVFLKIKTKNEQSKAASCIFHTFNPNFTKDYVNDIEPKIINLIKKYKINNGTIMFQGFEDRSKFYFHESGLRPGGDQYYVFTEQLFNISQLNSLIEFALTGCISLNDGELIDSYNFNQFCCNYYVPLKEGIISKINGLEQVKKLPGVLQLLQFKNIGDSINSTTSLDRVIFRIHVMEKTKEKFCETLVKISNLLEIFDEKGNDMQMQKLDYEFVDEAFRKSWL